MFIIRWLLILNSIIPALILFPIKKIYLRKDKKQKYKGNPLLAAFVLTIHLNVAVLSAAVRGSE